MRLPMMTTATTNADNENVDKVEITLRKPVMLACCFFSSLLYHSSLSSLSTTTRAAWLGVASIFSTTNPYYVIIRKNICMREFMNNL